MNIFRISLKRFMLVLPVCVFLFAVILNGCSASISNDVSPPTTGTVSEQPDKETPQSTEQSDKEEETPQSTEQPEVKSGSSAALEIEAEDANLYNTKENPVPLGKWVCYQAPNYTSDTYEPFYVRIVGVSRDPAEVQAAIDAYDGIMDLTLTEDQARDIEFGIVKYEIYFAPDYSAAEYGITVPTMSWSALSKEGGFKTDGGMSYIGIGSAYSLGFSDSGDNPQPGDTVPGKSLFTILKNYDESEYLFSNTWYDGEIVSEKARELYFSVAP